MQLTKFLLAITTSALVLTSCSTDVDDPINELQEPHLLNLGASSKDLLTDTAYKSLTIEILSVEGYEPSSFAIKTFETFLKKHLDKPDGIFIEQRTITSLDKEVLSIAELSAIERRKRTLYNTGDDLTVFIYFTNGTFHLDNESQKTLGSAYHNTSIAIYGNTLQSLAKRADMPMLEVLEATTMMHEFCHLLGLTNIHKDKDHTHEHPLAKGHCSVKGCLMESNIYFGEGIDLMNLEVPQLDAKCIADLKALAEK